MDKFLLQFQNDEHTREAVQQFLYQELDKMALQKIYDKEDTSGIADAKELITLAFIELNERYGKKTVNEVQSIR